MFTINGAGEERGAVGSDPEDGRFESAEVRPEVDELFDSHPQRGMQKRERRNISAVDKRRRPARGAEIREQSEQPFQALDRFILQRHVGGSVGGEW